MGGSGRSGLLHTIDRCILEMNSIKASTRRVRIEHKTRVVHHSAKNAVKGWKGKQQLNLTLIHRVYVGNIKLQRSNERNIRAKKKVFNNVEKIHPSRK